VCVCVCGYLADAPWLLDFQDDLFPQLLSFDLDTSTSDDLHDPLLDYTTDTDCTLVHNRKIFFSFFIILSFVFMFVIQGPLKTF